jgi:hypothetical protein
VKAVGWVAKKAVCSVVLTADLLAAVKVVQSVERMVD